MNWEDFPPIIKEIDEDRISSSSFFSRSILQDEIDGDKKTPDNQVKPATIPFAAKIFSSNYYSFQGMGY